MHNNSPPLWELRNISKAFYAVQALKDVSCTLVEGEIHALVGENGSGKSTLAKCLTGAHQPDSGEMLLRGKPITFHHPNEARAHGVAAIYQEFSLVPTLTVTRTRDSTYDTFGCDAEANRQIFNNGNRIDLTQSLGSVGRRAAVGRDRKAISLDSACSLWTSRPPPSGETRRLQAHQTPGGSGKGHSLHIAGWTKSLK